MAGRLQGWEMRLHACVEAARARPYRLGEHDCFRFACAVVEALTGADLWAPWAGRYRTRLGALRQIHRFGGGGFTEAGTKLFAVAPVAMGLARRGDIAEFADPDGEQHLGVALGPDVAVLAAGGLTFVKRSACRHVWRVG